MHPSHDFIENLKEHQKPLAEYLFTRIQDAFPQLFSSIKYRTLFFSGHRNICYFSVKNDGIDVGFIQGNQLRFRPEFIRANRKQVVSLFFRYDEDVNETLLFNVLNEAVKLDQSLAVSGKR